MNQEMFKNSNSSTFSEQDPFNKGYTLAGKVSQTRGVGGHFYGAIALEKVIHEPSQSTLEYDTPVIIHCTPKLHYPFTPEGKYTFPSASKIERYRKYDGTNVYMYRYRTPNGMMNTTYKSRRLPFLRPEFEMMWRKVLETHPDISKLYNANPNCSGFSFELYGKINHHMIEYDELLDAVLLFGRVGDDKVVSPSDMNTLTIPTPDLLGTVDSDYIWNYQQAQEEMEEALVQTEEGFKGDEGQVWYFTRKDDDYLIMYKCKPPTVEKIHWASKSIQKSIIRTAAQRVLEDQDTLELDDLILILQEDFTEEQIHNSLGRSKQIIKEVNVAHARNMKVKGLLKDIDYLNMELPDVMRAIHTHFDKSDMRHVFTYTKSLKDIGMEV